MAKGSSTLWIWMFLGSMVLFAAIPSEHRLGFLAISVCAGVVVAIVKRSRRPIAPTLDCEPTLAELMSQGSGALTSNRVNGPKQLGAHSPAPESAFIPNPQVSVSFRSQRTPDPEANSSTHPASYSAPEFYRATASAQGHATGRSYAVPKPPWGYGKARWFSANESVEIAGTHLPGGLFYVGKDLLAPSGYTDPCLIDPKLNVSSQGDFTAKQEGYWPSYSKISASQRRAFLNWLAQGRSDPECDVGYVFLFFYGLERRVIVDSQNDPAAKGDWPSIAIELRRLLSIYGQKSGSFRSYASELLDWIQLDTLSGRLYKLPVPELSRTYELPRYLRVALGQTAVDRVPVPAPVALAWVRLDPAIYLRTAATRCPEEFGCLFVERYQQLPGAGLLLPRNRTKLKFVYRPASAGLHGAGSLVQNFGDLPDVTALTAPLNTLKLVINQCTDDLAAFSRVVGKDPAARNSLDGLLHLPTSLWPGDAQAKIKMLVARMKDGILTTSLGDLVVALGGATQSLNRAKACALARALETLHVGLEPNVLAGAKAPNAADPVVLFSIDFDDASDLDTGAYQTAMLTLQLASAVAQADGEFSSEEAAHLRREVQSWSHLTPAHRSRLQAHLQWLVAAPVTLTSVKKKLEPLAQKDRETVAAFMATLAQADGVVSPQEVRFLEKVYKALGVESRRVFSDIHASSASVGSTDRNLPTGLRLDKKRIAELERDTQNVAALLADIFREEDPSTEPFVAEHPSDAVTETGLLGLDEAHTALARLMLSRPQWTREELEDAAKDLELMLDGALEHLNDASFDAFNLPLCEGVDPVEINVEVLEMIEQ